MHEGGGEGDVGDVRVTRQHAEVEGEHVETRRNKVGRVERASAHECARSATADVGSDQRTSSRDNDAPESPPDPPDAPEPPEPPAEPAKRKERPLSFKLEGEWDG